MRSYKPGDVIKVPFPYTDRPARQHRPALVIVAGAIAENHGLLWVLMITSAENRRWDDDVTVSNLDMAGLPARSVVRCAKIATIEAVNAEHIGTLPRPDRAKVAERLAPALAPIARSLGH